MSEKSRRRFFRRIILSVWAAITLILLFCVALLLNEMSRQGVEMPDLSAALPQTASTSQPSLRPTQSIRSANLYFADPDGTSLMSESADIALSNSTVVNCRTLVERLIEGPRSLDRLPIIPASVTLRGIYLLEQGELVIDLSREIAQDLPDGALAEGLFVYSIIGTVTQQSAAGEEGPVRSVRFLFEGAPQDRFPKHIDASAPIMPEPSWFSTSETVNG